MPRIILYTRGWSSWPEFAGSTWVPMQYLLGFRSLGMQVLWIDYLEKLDLKKSPHSVDYIIHQFTLTAREFQFNELYSIVYNNGERYFGLSKKEIDQFANETDLLISISGKGLPAGSPLQGIPHRAYLDVDPAFTQFWAYQVDMGFDHYNHFFTVGQNIGLPECKIPTLGLKWQHTLPPVVLDLWPAQVVNESYQRFSTISDWWGSQFFKYDGELYAGKREEFLRFVEVPVLAEQPVEVALTYSDDDYPELTRLRSNNWRILNPFLYAGDPLSYREFIQNSRAEFSVAKNGYVKTNSGWVSDRTACYLASGKPSIVQSTGFENALPSGKGLLTFRTIEEAVANIEAVNRDYLLHSQAARQLAEEYFDAKIVLSNLLERMDL